MLSKLAPLSISSIRKLDDEATKIYDRSHDLSEARFYTQHALRPYIDSEINQIHHIPFIKKGIEIIDLPSILDFPSIFRDNVISAIL